ncbi:MAG: FAD-dependent oxidoreductase [Haloplanus sp.]
MSAETTYDVCIVGGGVAGLSAATFTARHGLETLVLDAGESILRRNAHLENFPGFPAGVNARLLLELMGDQADRAGAERRDAEVTRVGRAGDENGTSPGEENSRFVVETADIGRYRTEYVVAATKNAVDYLDVDGVGVIDRGKSFVDVDEGGRTGVDGLYAAGRLAEKPHQTVVCAGHGAEVAVALLEDADRPFYHDWVTPEGYFTDRGRDLPPGCEEIDADERDRRERESLDAMAAYFAEPHPDEQETHPSLTGSEQ